MKLIAFESPTGPRIGEIRGATVRDLGPIDDYYADPEAAARTTAEPIFHSPNCARCRLFRRRPESSAPASITAVMPRRPSGRASPSRSCR